MIEERLKQREAELAEREIDLLQRELNVMILQVNFFLKEPVISRNLNYPAKMCISPIFGSKQQQLAGIMNCLKYWYIFLSKKSVS